MSSVRRRGGKPNRGGGTSNHSKGGGGRKSSSSGNTWYEDTPADGSGPPRPTGVPSRRGRGGRARGHSGGTSSRGFSRGTSSRGFSRGTSSRGFSRGTSSRGFSRGASSRGFSGGISSRGSSSITKRVPMQRLHMTAENQEMVEDMLRDLHRTEDVQADDDLSECEDQYEYAECEWTSSDHYWMESQSLVVEEAANFTDSDHLTSASENVSKFAINKLLRYGFDRGRCVKTLQKTAGDIGLALEVMLSDCFDLGMTFDLEEDKEEEIEVHPPDTEQQQRLEQDVPVSAEDIHDMRIEEMTALSSIYGQAFLERIPDRVWILELNLPFLDSLAEEADVNCRAADGRLKSVQADDDREVCRYFLRGACKFGSSRCRYRHESPHKASHQLHSYSDNLEEENLKYELEVRFPPGNRYPLQAPLIAFSSRNRQLSHHVCLLVTKHLLQEALDLATSQAPVVFLLVSTLEDSDVLSTVFGQSPLPYSTPEPLIVRTPPTLPTVELVKHVTPPLSADAQEKVNEADSEDEDGDISSAEKHKAMRQKYNRGRKEPQVVSTPREVARIDSRILNKFQQKQRQARYQAMQDKRQVLPSWDKRDEIIAAIRGSQVVVVSGMTGCGKSTQVPQYLLDASLHEGKRPVSNIVCTQPRRISAIAVSERVAEERAEKVGGVVGYQIRLETCMSSSTRLLFCTMGILLRRLEGDGALEGVTHVILDEVHERSEESDFLLMVLRDLLVRRQDLKLILMSATLNADLFCEYFNGCPVVDIPGKTFPVDEYFLEDAIEFTGYAMEEGSPFARPLKKMNARPGSGREVMEGGRGRGSVTVMEVEDELQLLSTSGAHQTARDNVQDQNLTTKQLFLRYSDYRKSTIKVMATMDHEKINYELIEALLEWIVYGDHQYPTGAVLVFLPGLQEITTLYEQLLSSSTFGLRNKHRFRMIPLHSSLSSEDQHAVFSQTPEGMTKIVIATNIAETSITIEDVVYVIDAGRMKEKSYDSDKGMESLETVWVSRANGLQRRGRAGRVAVGVCFHLFTSHRYEHHLRDQPVPEIQRAPLESTILRIKVLDLFMGLDIQDVLSKLIEPPSDGSIRNAIKRLQDLGALDLDGHLTALGYHLAALPVDVRIGKLMLFGTIFRCLDAALTIAATLSFRSPFVAPFDRRDEADKKKLEFAVGNSDHLTMLQAYNGWIRAQKRGGRAGYLYCQENFLSIKTLQMLASIKRQFAELLSDIGFIEEGLTARHIEHAARDGGDGIVETTRTDANSSSTNLKLLSAILVGALFPNVVQVMTPQNKFSQSGAGAVPKAPRPEDLRFKTKMDGYINVHPSSVNFQVRYYESPYLVYHEKVKTSKVYIRDCTMVSVYPLLLFGGNISIELDQGNFILSVDDGWIRFMATSHKVAELLRELRLELDQLLTDKIETPQMDLCTCPRGSRIIDTIVRLITTQ